MKWPRKRWAPLTGQALWERALELGFNPMDLPYQGRLPPGHPWWTARNEPVLQRWVADAEQRAAARGWQAWPGWTPVGVAAGVVATIIAGFALVVTLFPGLVHTPFPQAVAHVTCRRYPSRTIPDQSHVLYPDSIGPANVNVLPVLTIVGETHVDYLPPTYRCIFTDIGKDPILQLRLTPRIEFHAVGHPDANNPKAISAGATIRSRGDLMLPMDSLPFTLYVVPNQPEYFIVYFPEKGTYTSPTDSKRHDVRIIGTSGPLEILPNCLMSGCP